MRRDEAMVVLLRRCDRRIDSHIWLMLITFFGIFSILSLLRSVWTHAFTWPVLFLLPTYLIVSAALIYCVARIAHYIQIAESILGQLLIEEPFGSGTRINEETPTVRDLYKKFHWAALELLPSPGRNINRMRDIIHNAFPKGGDSKQTGGPFVVSFGFWRFTIIILLIFLSMMLVAVLL